MKNKLIKEVNGLRCIAILMVIFFHFFLILTPKYFAYYQKISSVFSILRDMGYFRHLPICYYRAVKRYI